MTDNDHNQADHPLIERIASFMHPEACPTDQRHLSRHDRLVLAEVALRVIRGEVSS